LSNVGKYESANPLKRWFLRRFLRKVRGLTSPLDGSRVLDVGVGEGLFWGSSPPRRVFGVDVRHDALRRARETGVRPVCASALLLPFPANTFDLVTAVEILEHLGEPETAAAELARVARRRCVVTVPWEPWFSLMVLAGSGSHKRRLGREPEHVQAFGPRELKALLGPHFANVRVETRLPWLVADADAPLCSDQRAA